MATTVQQLRALARRSNRARRLYERYYAHKYQALEVLAPFAPFSAGDVHLLSELTLQSASQTPSLLADVSAAAGHPELAKLSPSEFASRIGPGTKAKELATAFDRFGSDKATHGYHPIYAAVFEDIGLPEKLLEVGLGTNNEDVPSHMGARGVPGASLRAFRATFPRCEVFGADIDPRILFSEDGISTFHLDQTDPASLHVLKERLPSDLDLVIDDGLHSPNANLGVLLLGLHKVRKDGWIIIEDIAKDAEPIWQIVAVLLAPAHACYLIDAGIAYLFCVKVNPS
jgi:hypothetical protein